jgi:hypothetical protein
MNTIKLVGEDSLDMDEKLQYSKDSLDEKSIDWKRIAEPQVDQYDTLIALEFAKILGYHREVIGNDPTFFDAQVAIREDPSTLYFPDCIPVNHSHPNVKRGSDLIRLWQPVFRQFQLLIESVAILDYTPHPTDLIVGSICGSGTKGFGTIVSTINHHVGFAEALVHEMAHHKLRALGIKLEEAERIILNSPDQKFHSPIRYDSLRPMMAVLHAQYSYTYVSALDIQIINASIDYNRDYSIVEGSLANNLPKLEFGLRIIHENVLLDTTGNQFIEGLTNWSEKIFRDAYLILKKFQIHPKKFSHPLS